MLAGSSRRLSATRAPRKSRRGANRNKRSSRRSRDPVALDVLSVQELDRQRQHVLAPKERPNLRPYSNAALLQLGVDDLKRIQVETLR